MKPLAKARLLLDSNTPVEHAWLWLAFPLSWMGSLNLAQGPPGWLPLLMVRNDVFTALLLGSSCECFGFRFGH